MKDIAELIGIVRSVASNGVLGETEKSHLKSWADKNRNLTYDKVQNELVQLVDGIIDKQIITDFEREQIQYYSEQQLSETNTSNVYFELQNIIERIKNDVDLSDEFLMHIKRWETENQTVIEKEAVGSEILTIVEEIISRGIVTEDIRLRLNELLNSIINSNQLHAKLNHLRKLVKERKNIGLELIEILDNKDVLNYIHQEAEKKLRFALRSYSGVLLNDPEIVFVSLCLIGMLKYDGNYYENVRSTYSNLYSQFSEQKIEGTIRSILNKYRTNERNTEPGTRIINIALSNALVPAYFLPAFFDFIFDIYKLNFEYDLPKNIYEDFQFVYEGLRSNMLSDSDEIEINVTKKSYKLIKTTKQLIVDGKDLDSIIKLSIIVVKLIDKRVWDKDLLIINPYLKLGFEKWEATLKDDKTHQKHSRVNTPFRSRWEPKFQLIENSIFLVPPIHRIKSTYNYSEISQVLINGDETIFVDSRPDIREIIGGYQITTKPIHLDNPLGNLRYILTAGDEIIYDSKDKLFRNYIVFDEKSIELQNNTDYKGQIIVCAPIFKLPIPEYITTQNYSLGYTNVSIGDALLIDNDLFSFSSLAKPGVFGEKYKNQFLKKNESDELFPVYSTIKLLMFESETSSEKFEININGHPKKLNDYSYSKEVRQTSSRYLINLDLERPGIYTILIFDLSKGKRETVAVFRLGYDPFFTLDQDKIDDLHFDVKVNSGLLEQPIKKEIDIRSFSEDWLNISYDNESYTYYLPLTFGLFRFDNTTWKPFSDDIWIEDIQHSTILKVYGLDTDGLLVYSNSGKLLQEELRVINRNTYCEIPIGFLISYKEATDYSVLVFTKEGKSVGSIFCYNHCIMNQESTEIHFDPIERVLTIIPFFYGKGSVTFRISNNDGFIVFEKKHLQSGMVFDVDSLESFTNYRLSFYEEPHGLLDDSRDLMSINTKFFARSDFVGRYFRVKEVQFDQLIHHNFVRKTYSFRHDFVYFKSWLDDDLYEGEIIVKTSTGLFELFRVNPVEIEICSDVINDEIELAITKDGDGLFLDFDHHGIMNSLDNNRAIDIFSYTIDANGEETI